MPFRMLVTQGSTGDYTQTEHLIEEMGAENLIAEKGCDTNAIVAAATRAGIGVVILPKRNCKQQRPYDEYLYRIRHLVENAFLHLKRWRGIATRNAQNAPSFLAAVQIRCLFLWLAIS